MLCRSTQCTTVRDMTTTHAHTAGNILRNIAGGNTDIANRMAYALSDYGYDHLETSALGIDTLANYDVIALVDETIQSAMFDYNADNEAAQRVTDILARIYGTFRSGIKRDTVNLIVARARDEYGDTEPEFMRELECAIRRTFIGIYSVGI